MKIAQTSGNLKCADNHEIVHIHTTEPQTKKLKSAAENNPLHLTSEAANISSVGTNDPPSNCSLDFIQRVYA